MQLSGKICLVCGATRGVGKGIALGLGEAGATVYITGRTEEEGKGAVHLPGTLAQTSAEIASLGGVCVPIRCDHLDDVEVEKVFAKVQAEHGKLDVLVNCVWGGYEHFNDGTEFWKEKEFWTVPISRWDKSFQAGVRAHYVASIFAARMMIAQRSGLICNVSYFAAQRNDKGVAYGVAKAADDRMVACMAHELRDYKVATISLYPGLVRTESVMKSAEYFDLSNSESPRFLGRAVAALATDVDIMKRSGTIVVAANAAMEYGFKDIDGNLPRALSVDEI